MSHSLRRLIHLLLPACAFAPALPAVADEGDNSRIMVARPETQDSLHGATILLAGEMPDGSSMGFILNKPTPLTLGQFVPGHAASLKVSTPIFLGGPVDTNVVFALVDHAGSPGGNAVKVAPGMFLAIEADTVDRIIETESDHARLLVGMVWRPGELGDEMKRSLWCEMKADSQVILTRRPKACGKDCQALRAVPGRDLIPRAGDVA